MRIGLISDTHGFLDEAIFTHFSACDEVWHAGDFGSPELLEQLKQFRPTRGVFGNIDGAELRAELPRDLVWDCEGIRVYMTHIGGYPGRYDARARQELARVRPHMFLCGHSHILKVMRDPALELIHMNPGACGHQGWHVERTALRFTIDAGKIFDVEAIRLGKRGQRPPKI
ncbi:MAG TPA: metallophosphoesterase family protein [Bryobacteraceae bacterium]|nr:metallophosphoesterase family protein [Bryobacteraceae bacterium]